MRMEAIVLCGGMGTRLKEITGDLPKSMVDIHGKPFLEYILRMLADAGFEHVVLAVGYRAEVIHSYFGNNFHSVRIEYAVEKEPLGTGGAICNALPYCKQDRIFIMNGDTMAQVPFAYVLRQHRTGITICGKWMEDTGRYGVLDVDSENRVTAFREKQSSRSGYINAGIYLIDRNVIPRDRDRFSFEKDFLEPGTSRLNLRMVPLDGNFIDIGIPEDYRRVLDRSENYF